MSEPYSVTSEQIPGTVVYSGMAWTIDHIEPVDDEWELLHVSFGGKTQRLWREKC